MENNRKALKIVLTVLSCITSFLICGYSLFAFFSGNMWFIVVAVHFFMEGLMLFIASLLKDEYHSMRVMGVSQIIGIILMMDYLLLLVFYRDPQYIHYINAYVAFGAGALIKFILFIISTAANKKEYNPYLHGLRNNDFISFSYLILILELVIFYRFFPDKEVDLWIYIVEAGTNAAFTITCALLALSTDIRSKTREALSTKQKLKHVSTWFYDHEVSMFFGFIITIYTISMAAFQIIQGEKSLVYIFLISFYLGTALIRLINFLWHKGIQKASKGNKIKENRLSSWILLFDALVYFAFNMIICAGAVVFMLNKITVSPNVYLFLFITIPLGFVRFVAAARGIKINKEKKETYRLGLAYISLIGAFFNLLETIAIGTYQMPIGFKYFVVLATVGLLSIVVLIIAIIFLVTFIRSLIINSKSKEILNNVTNSDQNVESNK